MSQLNSEKYIGLEIQDACINDNKLNILFKNGLEISVYDDASYCCERRYLTTDDDVKSLIGGKLLHIISKDGPTEEDDWQLHETRFVEIQTDKGLITLTNHNDHNGYYGGFGLIITEN